jgi:hypothetical protein
MNNYDFVKLNLIFAKIYTMTAKHIPWLRAEPTIK